MALLLPPVNHQVLLQPWNITAEFNPGSNNMYFLLKLCRGGWGSAGDECVTTAPSLQQLPLLCYLYVLCLIHFNDAFHWFTTFSAHIHIIVFSKWEGERRKSLVSSCSLWSLQLTAWFCVHVASLYLVRVFPFPLCRSACTVYCVLYPPPPSPPACW